MFHPGFTCFILVTAGTVYSSLWPSRVNGASNFLSPQNVLDQYALNQSALEDCKLSIEVEGESSWATGQTRIVHTREEFWRHGDSARLMNVGFLLPQSTRQGDIPPDSSKDFVLRSDAINSDHAIINYTHYAKGMGADQVVIATAAGHALRELGQADVSGGWIRGWLAPTESERLDRLFGAAKKLSCQRMTQPEDPTGCVRLTAALDSGNYCIGFDTARGAAIVSVQVERGPKDTVASGPLWRVARSLVDQADPNLNPDKLPYSEKDSAVREVTVIDGVELFQVGSAWLPRKMTVQDDLTDRFGRHWKNIFHITCTNVDLSPAFDTSSFKLDVPDGTPVFEIDGDKEDPVPHVWKGGAPAVSIDQSVIDGIEDAVSKAKPGAPRATSTSNPERK